MSDQGGYFTQLGRIILYLGQIAANQTKEVAASIRAHADGVVQAMKATAIFIIVVPLLLLATALITQNGIFIGLAGMCIAVPALILHWLTRPVTALIELIDVPMPGGVRRRIHGAMKIWHAVVLGILYTMATISLFFTMLPFAANPAAMVVVMLAMMALWVAGKQVPFLGSVFQGVGYLFLIATFIFSCYWALFPKSAMAYREYLQDLDARSAGQTSSHSQPSSGDVPRDHSGTNPISVLTTKARMNMMWGLAAEREPDRIVICMPESHEWTQTGLQVQAGDVVFFRAKGKIAVSAVVGTQPHTFEFGPEGGWPDFMNQSRLNTCPYPKGQEVYNLMMGIFPQDDVRRTTPTSFGLVGVGAAYDINTPGMIQVGLNSPAYNAHDETTGWWIFTETHRIYDRPLATGSIEVAIWVERQRG